MDFPSAAAVEAYMDPALTGHADTNGTKRGSTDESPLPRAKRNRYISIACNECKRRKIKCNGENPCQRCGNLNLECVYAPNCCGHNFKDSEEWRQMATHIESLQHQVDTLFANLSNLRSEMSNGSGSVDPSLQTSMSAPRQAMSQRQDARTPVFHGPTSIAYTLDVAKSTMQTMGISADEPSDKTIGLDGRAVSPDAPEIISIPTGTKDPIWSISHSEALRLLTVYEEEVHEMYPVISLAHLRSHSETLYRFIEAMIRARMARVDKPGADAIHDDDTNIFKATLAIALTVEGKGHSDLGRQLFENVQPQVDAVLLGNASVKAIQLLALTAMYNYFCDNEGTSWRVIGLTARLCIELGLHRADTYEKMSQQEKDTSVLLFWSIVSLDRRWSFGTGMPFALQETDVDYALPRPGELSPYLTAVIGHCDLGSKVWRAVGFEKGGAGSQDITREDIRYLDYLIRQWHSKLPKDYYFDRSSLDTLDLTVPPSTLRLGLHLYLRQNSLLILIHRPVLYSVQSITRNPGQAQDVIDVARDTITVLSRINSACDIYSRSQALFNPFLTMSLAVLFLGVSHDPAKFAEQVREEYNLALDLVRGFSRDSWIAKRLWRTIRGLKDAAPKLGLVRNSNSTSESTGTKESKQASSRRTQSNNATAAAAPPVPGAADDDDDPSRSAALAMAGLAGHNLDGFDLYGNSQHPLGTAHGSNNGFAVGPQTVPTGWAGNGSLTASSVVSPDHMANDLDSLFAAAEAFSNGFGLVNGGVGGEGVDVGAGQAEFGGAAGVFGDEDELSRIMRDLF